MKAQIDVIKTQLEALQTRHAETLASAGQILTEAQQRATAAYNDLLHARAEGMDVETVNTLTKAQVIADADLRTAKLESDVQRTIATKLEGEIAAAQAELAQAQTDHAAETLEALQVAEKTAKAKRSELFEALFESHIQAITAHNLAVFIRAKMSGQPVSNYDLLPLDEAWQVSQHQSLRGEEFCKTLTTPSNKQIVARINTEVAAIGNV